MPQETKHSLDIIDCGIFISGKRFTATSFNYKLSRPHNTIKGFGARVQTTDGTEQSTFTFALRLTQEDKPIVLECIKKRVPFEIIIIELYPDGTEGTMTFKNCILNDTDITWSDASEATFSGECDDIIPS